MTNLDGVEAARDASVLNFDVWWWVGELALSVGTRALVARKLPTHFQRQPARVLHVGVEHVRCEKRVDDGHGRRSGGHVELRLCDASQRRLLDPSD